MDSCPPYGLPAVCLASSDNVVRPIPIPTPTLARFRVPASLLVLARTRSLPSPAIFLAREATLLGLLLLGVKPLRSRRQPSPLSFLFHGRRRPRTLRPAPIVMLWPIQPFPPALLCSLVLPSVLRLHLRAWWFPPPFPSKAVQALPRFRVTATFPGTPTFLRLPDCPRLLPDGTG